MRYRDQLPQLGGGLFMTDGGIETTLIFHGGFDLPEFAAVDLLRSEDGAKALRSYGVTFTDARVIVNGASTTTFTTSDWKAL